MCVCVCDKDGLTCQGIAFWYKNTLQQNSLLSFGCFMEEQKFISNNNVKKIIPEKFGRNAGQFSLAHRDDDIVLIWFTIWRIVIKMF